MKLDSSRSPTSYRPLQRRAKCSLQAAFIAALAAVCLPAAASAAIVAAGDDHTCAVAPSGAVKCWGYNGYGQIADPSGQNSATPVSVAGLGAGANRVATGRGHSCAGFVGGSVKCWGFNLFGQLGDGGTTTSYSPVAVTGLSGAVRFLSSGGEADHTCAITVGSELQCWGLNNFAQVGTASSTSVVSTPVTVGGLGGFPVEVGAGRIHTCALLASGSVRCWGANYGLYGNGTDTAASGPTPVEVTGISSGKSLAVGSSHTCVALELGGVKCWGSNILGQLGDGTTTGRNAPVSVVDLPAPAVQVVAGYVHTCALLVGGTVRCWGNNGVGQLGDGANTDSSRPVLVQGLDAPPVALAAGLSHTCAVLNDGRVKCWGDNLNGQLGNGSTDTLGSNLPVAAVGVALKPSAPVITAQPAAVTNSPSATVTFTQPEGLSLFACSIDGAPLQLCSSPVSRSALPDGVHSVSVRAKWSSWSELSSESASATWTVDTTAPRLLGKTKTRTSTRTTYRLTVGPDLTGIAKVEYSTATRAPSASASPVASRTLSYASPLVIATRSTVRWLRLRDGAGNWSRWYAG